MIEIEQVLDELASDAPVEKADWGDVRKRARRRSRGYGALAVATIAVAAAVALSVSTPWNSSPGFLEKAQAALARQPGMVVHQKWVLRTIATNPACNSKRTGEVWIDPKPPYTYRALIESLPDPDKPDPRDPRVLVCPRHGPVTEIGGRLDSAGHTLRFVTPNSLRAFTARLIFPVDPVGELREAISTGRAHDLGKTQLDGRTVERIRFDPPSECPLPLPVPGYSCEPADAYVDPETFHPVRRESTQVVRVPFGPLVRFRAVERTLTFEYLPRTETNLELTDIEAQHPTATRS